MAQHVASSHHVVEQELATSSKPNIILITCLSDIICSKFAYLKRCSYFACLPPRLFQVCQYLPKWRPGWRDRTRVILFQTRTRVAGRDGGRGLHFQDGPEVQVANGPLPRRCGSSLPACSSSLSSSSSSS